MTFHKKSSEKGRKQRCSITD